LRKKFPISIPKSVLIDFVFSELNDDKRDNYLLEIKVHRQYSDLHCNEAGDMEVFYRKLPKQEPVELTRKEFKTLLKSRQKNANIFGLIGFSIAFKKERLLDLIFVETWGKRSEAVRYDVKIIGNRLESIEDSLDIVWHLKSP